MALASVIEGPEAQQQALGAAQAFEALMRLDPTDERGPRFYLQALLDAGDLKRALAFLRKQHSENPRDVQIVASLGMVSSKAGRFEEALSWYEKRAALLPKEAKARYLIGTLCWQHLYKNATVNGTERIRLSDRGLLALRQAMSLDPRDIDTLTYINLLYRERALGQTDAAAREQDLAQAQKYYQDAMERIRVRGAASRTTAPGERP